MMYLQNLKVDVRQARSNDRNCPPLPASSIIGFPVALDDWLRTEPGNNQENTRVFYSDDPAQPGSS